MFEKEAETKLSEEDYKLAEETIKPIYRNAIKNDYSFAKYGVECYLTGYNKANEWHYVKDGDLPNKGVLCAVLLINNDLVFARLREDNVWTTDGHNAFENVIAWKEIVPPKEIE